MDSTYWLVTGVAVGVVLTLLVIAIIAVFRGSGRKTRNAASGEPGLPSPSTSSSTKVVARKSSTRIDSSGDDAARSEMKERENRLAEMLAEMRELILRLTEIVATADTASGEASARFEQARRTLDNLDLDGDAGLTELKTVLLTEIDKVVKTNETLKRQLVVAQTGIATQKKEIEELKTSVRVDNLTQLPNRAAFDERLREVMYKVKRLREVFCLLMLDIDFFKKVNDTYGHVNGDRILKEIAAKIKESIRLDDFAARYGGEEFAVILPDTPTEEALAVAERMRDAIKAAPFELDGKPLTVTISGGLAQCREECEPEELIRIADKALYQSKSKGRNRITLGGDKIKEPWTTGEGGYRR